MMDDQKLAPEAPADTVLESQNEPAAVAAAPGDLHAGDQPPADQQPASPQPDAPAAPAPVSAAVEKFRSCRWRATPEDGEFCTHRDVLPFAGKEGFVADSWCPDCAFYKLRRTPKKRERLDYTY
jgi:hypothetical protein